MKNRWMAVITGILLTLFGALFSIEAQAAEITHDRAKIMIDSYEIIEGTVAPGQDVTLRVDISNHGRYTRAQNITVSVVNNQGVVFPMEGKSNQAVIGNMDAQESLSIEMELTIAEDIGKETQLTLVFYFVYMDVSIAEASNESYISIPIEEVCSLGIDKLDLSDNCYKEENAILSSTIMNDGNAAVENAVLHVTGNVEGGSYEYELGNIGQGATRFYDHSIRFLQDGAQQIEAYLSYFDGNGNEYVTEASTYNFRVLEGNSGLEKLQNGNGGLSTKDMLVNLVLLAAAAAMIVFSRRRNHRKISSRRENVHGN